MAFLSTYYPVIKQLHILTALISLALFLTRFWMLMRQPVWLGKGWVRVTPHINDTLLLTFAVLLCFATRQTPLVTPWLTEKVVFVLLYILAAMFALKKAKTRPGQIIWFIIALLLFAYTANIAVHKTPLVF